MSNLRVGKLPVSQVDCPSSGRQATSARRIRDATSCRCRKSVI